MHEVLSAAEIAAHKTAADAAAQRDDGRRAEKFPPSIERLVRLYEAWGKPDKAAEWRSKLAEIEAAPTE